MRFPVLFLCLSTVLCAQQISLGVVGGGSLTPSFTTQNVATGQDSLPFQRFYSPSNDYIVGAMMEFRLPLHLSLEVDGLFRKLHFTTAGVEPDGTLNSVSPSPVITWEFPALAKYRFARSKTNPFIEAGPSFRTAGNLNGTNPSHYGITAGVGVEMHLGAIDLAPVVRYTRWAPDSVSAGIAHSNPDQVELLFEVSHGSEIHGHPWGQHFALGIIGGTTLRRDLPSQTLSTLVGIPTGGGVTIVSQAEVYRGLTTFLVGPTVEFALPRNLYVETDAVYHPLREREQINPNGTVTQSATFNDAITWEFPLLAKYKFPWAPVKPFGEVGPSFRLPQGMDYLSTRGTTIGAGVEMHLRALKIAPVLRYTHWNSDRTRTTTNQVEVLAALFF
jgi:hypothetical protein